MAVPRQGDTFLRSSCGRGLPLAQQCGDMGTQGAAGCRLCPRGCWRQGGREGCGISRGLQVRSFPCHGREDVLAHVCKQRGGPGGCSRSGRRYIKLCAGGESRLGGENQGGSRNRLVSLGRIKRRGHVRHRLGLSAGSLCCCAGAEPSLSIAPRSRSTGWSAGRGHQICLGPRGEGRAGRASREDALGCLSISHGGARPRGAQRQGAPCLARRRGGRSRVGTKRPLRGHRDGDGGPEPMQNP